MKALIKLSVFLVWCAVGVGVSFLVWEPSPSIGQEEGSTEAAKERVVTPVTTPPPASAVATATPSPEAPPKLGLLASSMPSLGYGSKGVATATDTDVSANTSPIIGGSLSKTAKGWKVLVSNSGKNTYSVSVRIDQMSREGRVVKSDSATYSLAPSEKGEREFTGSPTAIGASLYLVSARKVNGASRSLY